MYRGMKGNTQVASPYRDVAAKGRRGDTRMAHVTPGEVIVPKEVVKLRPDIMRHIGSQIRSMGGNPRRLTVGRGRINPRTGIEEFATEAEVRAAYESQLGRAPDAAGLAYWMGQDNNFDTAFQTAAQQEIANRPTTSDLNQVYQTELGRPIDEEGLDYWTQDVIKNPGMDYKTAIITAAAKNAANQKPIPTPTPAPVEDPYDKWQTSFDTFTENQAKIAEAARLQGIKDREAADLKTQGLLEGIKEGVSKSGLDYVDAGRSTVAGQLNTLLGANSPYIAEARRSGMLEAAKRGGVNSTASASAAQRAAIQAAFPIASQDANTYAFAQGRQQEGDIASGLSTQQFGQERVANSEKYGYESSLQDRQIAGTTAGQLAVGAQGIQGDLATGAQRIAGDMATGAQTIAGNLALSNQQAADNLTSIAAEGNILKERDSIAAQKALDLAEMGIEADTVNAILGINGRLTETTLIAAANMLSDINIEDKGAAIDILKGFLGDATFGATIMTGLEA